MKEKIRSKMQTGLYEVALFMEHVIGVLIVGALVISVVGLLQELNILFWAQAEGDTFHDFLAAAFSVVIGIEFLKMLCRHNLSSVIEVLLFAIARGMVVEHTTPMENLLSIISIAVLFMIRKYLFIPGVDSKREKHEHI